MSRKSTGKTKKVPNCLVCDDKFVSKSNYIKHIQECVGEKIEELEERVEELNGEVDVAKKENKSLKKSSENTEKYNKVFVKLKKEKDEFLREIETLKNALTEAETKTQESGNAQKRVSELQTENKRLQLAVLKLKEDLEKRSPDEELSRLRSHYDRQVKDERDKHKKEISSREDRHKSEILKLKAAYEELVETTKLKATEKLMADKSRYEKQISDLEKQRDTDLADYKRVVTHELKKDFDQQIMEHNLKKDRERLEALSLLEKKYNEESAQRNNTLRTQLQTMERDYRQKIKEQNDSFQKKKVNLEKESEVQLQTMKTLHMEELKEAKKELDNILEMEKARYKMEIEQVRKDYEVQFELEKHRYEMGLETAQTEVAKQVEAEERRFRNLLDNRTKEHELQIDTLKREAAAMINAERNKYELELKSKDAAFENQNALFSKKLEAEKEMSLNSYKTEVEQTLKLSYMKKEHALLMQAAQIQENYRLKLEEMKSEYDAKLKVNAQKMESDKKLLQKEYQLEIDTVKKKYAHLEHVESENKRIAEQIKELETFYRSSIAEKLSFSAAKKETTPSLPPTLERKKTVERRKRSSKREKSPSSQKAEKKLEKRKKSPPQVEATKETPKETTETAKKVVETSPSTEKGAYFILCKNTTNFKNDRYTIDPEYNKRVGDCHFFYLDSVDKTVDKRGKKVLSQGLSSLPKNVNKNMNQGFYMMYSVYLNKLYEGYDYLVFVNDKMRLVSQKLVNNDNPSVMWNVEETMKNKKNCLVSFTQDPAFKQYHSQPIQIAGRKAMRTMVEDYNGFNKTRISFDKIVQHNPSMNQGYVAISVEAFVKAMRFFDHVLQNNLFSRTNWGNTDELKMRYLSLALVLSAKNTESIILEN